MRERNVIDIGQRVPAPATIYNVPISEQVPAMVLLNARNTKTKLVINNGLEKVAFGAAIYLKRVFLICGFRRSIA